MALTARERQNLVRDVANASRISENIIKSKMTEQQLIEAGQ